MRTHGVSRAGLALLSLTLATGCRLGKKDDDKANDEEPPPLTVPGCVTVGEGFGPSGTVAVKATTVVEGLEVPWGLAFLSPTELLVTERPGRLRMVQGGLLVAEPVLTLAVSSQDESGLLDVVLHPGFATNRLFYLYYTVDKETGTVNRVERYRLADDGRGATVDRLILDDLPAAKYHDGGRMRFGPDGMLYVSVGDARQPDAAQDLGRPLGKLLRLTPEGAVPPDNPWPGNSAFLTGVRNSQGFDWLDGATLVVTDHGPSGELGRKGHDEISVARAGANLGWPTIYGCGVAEGMVTPLLAWREANPPGGAHFYTGDAIPGWKNSLLVGTLLSKHLHRVVVEAEGPGRLRKHEVYLSGEPPTGLGRIRTVVQGPDGLVYVTTSNCDGRGSCPAGKDRIVRVNP